VIELGAAVDAADPIAEAEERGAQVVQVHLSDPQTWKPPMIAYPGGARALREALAAANLRLFVHSPYLVNVATTNSRVRIPSRAILQKTLNVAAEVGAAGVVVHGGHVTKDDDPEVGFENWRKAVDRLEIPVPLLIENTAGGANAMARHLDRIARLWEVISASSNIGKVGFCLDTCHAHAAGLDLHTVAGKILEITGRLDLVHANDSKDAFGSARDRHENLACCTGQCDPQGIITAINTANAPVVVETPGGTAAQAADLRWLRELLPKW
jgi:deoxyribonuclease-4